MKQVIDETWVMSRRNQNHGLDPIKSVLQKYDNPQNDLNVIHVAGTNGKGSTCNYLAHILMACGYKVGMFTSPHLVEHRDRIRINGTYIPKETFLKYLHEMEDDIVQNELGMFEIDTCIAYRYFHDEHVDYAIVECGLGGRLDSTNVVDHPKLCLITSIGKDHTEILGERVSQIAFEKAGIITHRSKVLSGIVSTLIKDVIRHVSLRKQASYIMVKPYSKVNDNTIRYDGDVYTLQTKASYQYQNVTLALEAAKALGMNIHADVVKQSIASCTWPGRFEKVWDQPTVVIDGAHNTHGMQSLVKSFKNLKQPIVSVFSALKDKPTHEMANLLQSNCEKLYITVFENKRSDTLENLAIEDAILVEDYKQAILCAIHDHPNGTIVITGSLYFISEVRALFLSENFQKQI